MGFVSPEIGFFVIAAIGAAMFIATLLDPKKKSDKETFLVSGRREGLLFSVCSIVATWIQAPAIVLIVQIAFIFGLAGAFWFTLPNMLALMIFAPFAVRLRTIFPHVYTITEFLKRRFEDSRVHSFYVVNYIFLATMILATQIYVGALIISTLSGLSSFTAAALLTATFTGYSLLSGLRSSIFTDFIQMVIIAIIAFLLTPMVILASGTNPMLILSGGLSGLKGSANLLSTEVFMAFGLWWTMNLIFQLIDDSTQWQRVFSTKQEVLKKSFIISGFLFAVIPIVLSLTGIASANPEVAQRFGFTASQASQIGPLSIAVTYGFIGAVIYMVLLYAALASTGDSCLNAGSSIASIDIYRTYLRKHADDRSIVRASQIAMLIMAVVAFAIAVNPWFGDLINRIWINSVLRSAAIPAVALGLFSSRLSASGASHAILAALGIGIAFIAMNYLAIPEMRGIALLIIMSIGLLVCYIQMRVSPAKFDFEKLKKT